MPEHSDLHDQPLSPAEHLLPELRLPVPLAATQGTLALALLPRRDPPPVAAAVPARDTGTGTATGPTVVPIDRRLRRSIEGWAHRFAQAAVEIVAGDRPASQLVRWTSSDVYADLSRRALLVARAGGHQPGVARVQPVRPRVHSVHPCFVGDGVVETGIHVRYGERSRAIAARFEDVAGRWVCTAFDFA